MEVSYMKRRISRKTRNKLKNITTVIPYKFERSLILSLDNQWNKVFGGKLSFKVVLDNRGRLCIISKKCLKR